MASNLTAQVRKHRGRDHRVARGDLSRKITRRGERRDSSSSRRPSTRCRPAQRFRLRGERVAREVAPRAKLAARPGARRRRHVKDLTDNVNSMAANLTGQVRNIAEVTTAVARRFVPQDHRRRPPNSRAEGHHQHHVTSSTLRLRVTRVAAESAPRASSAARPRCAASAARGRSHRQCEFRWRTISRRRSATSPT